MGHTVGVFAERLTFESRATLSPLWGRERRGSTTAESGAVVSQRRDCRLGNTHYKGVVLDSTYYILASCNLGD